MSAASTQLAEVTDLANRLVSASLAVQALLKPLIEELPETRGRNLVQAAAKLLIETMNDATSRAWDDANVLREMLHEASCESPLQTPARPQAS